MSKNLINVKVNKATNDQTFNANFQCFTDFDTLFYGHISINARKVSRFDPQLHAL